jgi:hypothetical protein
MDKRIVSPRVRLINEGNQNTRIACRRAAASTCVGLASLHSKDIGSNSAASSFRCGHPWLRWIGDKQVGKRPEGKSSASC